MTKPEVNKSFDAGMLKVLKEICERALKVSNRRYKAAVSHEEESKLFEEMWHADAWVKNLTEWQEELNVVDKAPENLKEPCCVCGDYQCRRVVYKDGEDNDVVICRTCLKVGVDLTTKCPLDIVRWVRE